MADPVIVAEVEAPVEASIAGLAANIIASSDVDLDGRRISVRSGETNQGNLVADAMLWQARSLAGAFGVAGPDVAFQNGGGTTSVPSESTTSLDSGNRSRL